MMKTLFTLSLSILFLVSGYSQDKNVLFIGNSYMYTNDLPTVLDNIANSNSVVFDYEQNTIAAYTLEQHTNNATTMDLIAQGGWDHVIFQEQSQLPSFPMGQVEQDVFPYAELLADSAFSVDQCGVPIFMMTWGRENGDADNCDNWPPVCDYDGMQDLLSERYIQMAEDNDAWTAPVGEAWRTVRDETDDLINLYSSDGSHPSFAGTYLAACVLFATIYGESPVGTDYIGELTEADAEYLQEVAAETVLEDSEEWNIQPVVWADVNVGGFAPSFTISVEVPPSVDSLHFTDENSTFTWFDGSSSGFFIGEGTYYYVVDVFSPCGELNFLDSIVVQPTHWDEIGAKNLLIYPNPSQGIINVESELVGQAYSISDINGKVVLTGRIESQVQQIALTELVPGVYHLTIQDGVRSRKSFVIN